jgi:mannose-6-phosphate isomerase-like protein (cupin superfamily)
VGKVLHLNDVPAIEAYKGLQTRLVVNENTCGATLGEFGHTIMRPGIGQRRHFHPNCEGTMFVVRGRLRCFLGDPGEEIEAGAGSFIFTRQGEVHAISNPSETEDCELVWTHSGVPSFEKAGTVFVE